MDLSKLKFSRELEEQFVSLLGDIKDQYYNQGLVTGKKIGFTQGYAEGLEVGRKNAYSEATEVVGKKALDRFVQLFKEIDAIDTKIDNMESPAESRKHNRSTSVTTLVDSADTSSSEESDGSDQL